jgi:hypothetical protein
MSVISITKLYDQLAGKMGKETAENLTTFIDNKIDQVLESKLNILESKIDNLASNMATKTDLADTKSELMKWMFIFWVGQAAVTFGYILLFIKK